MFQILYQRSTGIVELYSIRGLALHTQVTPKSHPIHAQVTPKSRPSQPMSHPSHTQVTSKSQTLGTTPLYKQSAPSPRTVPHNKQNSKQADLYNSGETRTRNFRKRTALGQTVDRAATGIDSADTFEGCLTAYLHHGMKRNVNFMQQCDLLS